MYLVAALFIRLEMSKAKKRTHNQNKPTTAIMLSFFKRELKSPPDKPRGYKITNTSRNRKYGIAATSYAVFKRKVEDKLKVINFINY